MKISFSTLACPDWSLAQVLETAASCGYGGIELRFLEGEGSLWKLAAFRGTGLRESCKQIAESGIAISCLDTSCRFDSPLESERHRWIEEGFRMVELAVALGAPGIRVFGDRIQPGNTRDATRAWIIDSVNILAGKIGDGEVRLWLETHGDFSCADDVRIILDECPGIGLVWDPVSSFTECGERPSKSGFALKSAIRHVHIKDVRNTGTWSPALIGEGEFPVAEMHNVLHEISYQDFVSFEWEKKWHPEIESPDLAIPHFANWFRKEWESLGTRTGNRTGSGVHK